MTEEKRTTTGKLERVVPPKEPVTMVLKEETDETGRVLPEGVHNPGPIDVTEALRHVNDQLAEVVRLVQPLTKLPDQVKELQDAVFGDSSIPPGTPSAAPITRKVKALTAEQSTLRTDIKEIKDWQAKQMQTMGIATTVGTSFMKGIVTYLGSREGALRVVTAIVLILAGLYAKGVTTRTEEAAARIEHAATITPAVTVHVDLPAATSDAGHPHP